MALTKAQREQRAAEVLTALRSARNSRALVVVTLQRGRKRPRVTGRVRRVAESAAFVWLDRDDFPLDRELGERRSDPLHVPVDVIRSVRPVK